MWIGSLVSIKNMGEMPLYFLVEDMNKYKCHYVIIYACNAHLLVDFCNIGISPDKATGTALYINQPVKSPHHRVWHASYGYLSFVPR